MEFVGDIARKTGDAALLAVEAEKSRRAAEIGGRSGLFRVPTVLSFDETAATLEFVREPNLVTFARFIGEHQSESLELASRIGRAIARFHAELRLDEPMQTPLPQEWSTAGEEPVFLHGDLTSNNICVDMISKQLVIVDWSAAPMVGRIATMGPRSFDVLCLIRHIMMGATWQRAVFWPGRELSDRIVMSYVEESGAAFSRESWSRHAALLDSFSDGTVRERIANAPFYIRPGKSWVQRLLLRRWHRYTPPDRTITD